MATKPPPPPVSGNVWAQLARQAQQGQQTPPPQQQGGLVGVLADLASSLRGKKQEAPVYGPAAPDQRIGQSGITEKELATEIQAREAKRAGEDRARMMEALVRQRTTPQETGPLRYVTAGMNYATAGVDAAKRAAADPEALVRRGEERGGVGGAFQGAAGKMLQAFQSDSELQGVGHSIAAGGKLAGQIPVIGKPIEATTKFAESLIDAVEKIRNWTSAVHQSNMKFAEWSVSMSNVQARQQMRDIMLDRSKGEARAGSADFAAEQASKLNTSLSGIENQFAQVKSYASGILSWALDKTVGTIAETTAMILEKITFGMLKAEEPDPDAGMANRWMYEKGADFAGDVGKPRRFGGGG